MLIRSYLLLHLTVVVAAQTCQGSDIGECPPSQCDLAKCATCVEEVERVDCVSKCRKRFASPEAYCASLSHPPDTTVYLNSYCTSNCCPNTVDQTVTCSMDCTFLSSSCASCQPGYYGPPDCLPCPLCEPGQGTCDSVSGVCLCEPGYLGPLCQYSDSDTCNDYGIVDAQGTCFCNANRGGDNCERCADAHFGPNCELCDSNTCSSHGTCPNGTCVCDAGYAPQYCDACDTGYLGYPNCLQCTDAITCNGHGRCSQQTGQCVCDQYHAGSGCDICDAGRWGETCAACPGPLGNPCNVQSDWGQCNDGFYDVYQGSPGAHGECVCVQGRSGTECENIVAAIEDVSPPNGITGGGYTLTIKGTNFGNSAGSVEITPAGGTEQTCTIDVWGDNLVTCQAPAGAMGPTTVTLTPADIGLLAVAVGPPKEVFSYDAARITKMTCATPEQPLAVGETCVLEGINFGSAADNLQVEVRRAGGSWFSSGVATGDHKTRTVDVVGGAGAAFYMRLLNAGDKSGEHRFSYAVPVLDVVTPDTSSTSGGTDIVITGRNFGAASSVFGDPVPSVVIGSRECVSVQRQSDSKLGCTTTEGIGIELPVTVTIDRSVGTRSKFFHYANPIIEAITGCDADGTGTKNCNPEGTNTIVIHGKNFGRTTDGAVEVYLRIGGTDAVCANAQVSTPHVAITCDLPAGRGSKVPVVVVVYPNVGKATGLTVSANLVSYSGPWIIPTSIDIVSGQGSLSTSGGVRTVNPHTSISAVKISLAGIGLGTPTNVPLVRYGAVSDITNDLAEGYELSCTVDVTSLSLNGDTLDCTTAAGLGRDLRFRVELNGLTSNIPLESVVTYPLPVVDSDSFRLPESGQGPASTLTGIKTSDELVGFSGSHLGNDASLRLGVFYGPPSGNLTEYRCIHTRDGTDSEVLCKTTLGQGTVQFKLLAGTAGQYPAHDHVVVTSIIFNYPGDPRVYSVSEPGDQCNQSMINPDATENCPTSGRGPADEYVILTISGSLFGTSDATVQIGDSSCLFAPRIVVPNTAIECYLRPGVGTPSISVSRLDIKGLPTDNLLSYARPIVHSVRGCVNVASATSNCDRNGGTVLEISGESFGEAEAVVVVGGSLCGDVVHQKGLEDIKLTCVLAARTTSASRLSVVVFQNAGLYGQNPDCYVSYEPCPAGQRQDGLVACTPCEAGHFSALENERSCRACPKGQYQPTDGNAGCLQCPPGSEGLVPAAQECTPCAPGHSNPVFGSIACLPCSAGRFSLGTGAKECVRCAPGRAQPLAGQRQCDACDYGRFSGEGQISCSPCDARTFVDTQGASTCNECPSGRTGNDPVLGSRTCTKCGLGRSSRSGNACQACLPGRFSSTEGAQQCTLCPFGKFTAAPGSANCSLCEPGTFGDQLESVLCSACLPGYFSAREGALTCDPCPLGFYQPDLNGKRCEPCPVGSFTAFFGQRTCALCEAGKYTDQPESVECTECPPGNHSDTKTRGGASSCPACAPGKFSSTPGYDECLWCPKASYNGAEGATSCAECRPGTYSSATGAEACLPCQVGKYALSYRNVVCLACPSGRSTNFTGSITCPPCAKGKYQSRAGEAECRACGEGSSMALEGASACDACPAGRFSNSTGLKDCWKCPIGKFSASAVVEGLGPLSCADCPVAKSNSREGAPACDECPTGRFSNSTGLIECEACLPGYFQSNPGQLFCPICSKGRFSVGDQSNCTSCPPGRWNDEEGLDQCYPCAKGRSQSYSGMQTCEPCKIGTFMDAEGRATCSPCAPGRFTITNATTNCTLCQEGEYQELSGQLTCKQCTPGTYSDDQGRSRCLSCEPGRFNNETSMNFCHDCGVGLFQSQDGKLECQPCPVGTFSNGGLAQCASCGRGTFSNRTRADKCEPCPPGQSQSATGSVACKDCAPGLYAILPESTSCQACPGGRFSNVTGAIQCDPCPPGSFGPGSGVSWCELCPPGKFGDLSAQLACLDCPAGTFAGGNGSSDCELCPPGRFGAEQGWTECRQCGAGTSSGSRSTACARCSELEVAAPGSAECRSCGPNARSNGEGTVCECKRGLFMTENQDNSSLPICQACPRGTVCTSKGVTWDTIRTAKGFWRQSQHTSEWYLCRSPDHCEGGVHAACAEYREGPLCALCVPGALEMPNGACGVCPPSSTMALVQSVISALGMLIVLGLCFLFLIKRDQPMLTEMTAQVYDDDHQNDLELMSRHAAWALRLRKEEELRESNRQRCGVKPGDFSAMNLPAPPKFPVSEAVQQGKIMLVFLQLATHLALHVDMPWPSAYRDFLTAFDILNLDFLPWSAASCLYSVNFYTKLVIMTLLPFLLVAVLALVFAVIRFLPKTRCLKPDRNAWKHFRKLSYWTMYLVYTRISSQCFQIFSCKEVEGEWWLTPDFSLRCFDTQWTNWVVVDSFLILLVPIGIPAAFFVSMYKNKDRLNTLSVRYEMDFLYSSFTPAVWWFEMADCMHKLSLTAVIVGFPEEYKLRVAMLIITAYFYTLMYVQPYFRVSDLVLHLTAQVELFLLCLAGQTFLELEEVPEVSDHAMSVFLIILTFGFLGLGFYHLRIVMQHYWVKFAKLTRLYKEPTPEEAKASKKAAREKRRRTAALSIWEDVSSTSEEGSNSDEDEDGYAFVAASHAKSFNAYAKAHDLPPLPPS